MKLMIIGVTLAGFAAFTPLSAQRPSGNQRTSTQNCTTRNSGSVSDVILGRRSASTVGCVDNRTVNQRVNRTNQQVNGGGWYQVGNDGYGTIYERQTQDQYGNVVIQRARRDRNGNMSIISTRSVANNGTYNNGGYNNSNGTYSNRRRSNGNGDNDDQGNYQNGKHDNGNHYGQYKNGKGKGNNKNKKHGDD